MPRRKKLNSCIAESELEEECLSEIEIWQEKMCEAMDLAEGKCSQTRTNAFISLTNLLQKRVMFDFLLGQYETLSHLVERSLKKGHTNQEQIEAAHLLSVLVISLCQVQEAEQSTTDDNFSNIQSSSLYTAALNGFCLLMCVLTPNTLYTMAQSLLEEFYDLLGHNTVELRIQAGQGVALLYQLVRQHDNEFSWQQEECLCQLLQELTTDSHKYRAKRDRKEQRAWFRDVVHTLQNDDDENHMKCIEKVTVGPEHDREKVLLDTWCLKTQYKALCNVLGEGLNTHLTYNVGVRDVFNLGPPPDPQDHTHSPALSRSQKKINKLKESTVSKARQRTRKKNRDNKATDKTYQD
ncbi:hypothetical protein Pcinc_005461 [Petrolisthes cinctipes]|uniref:Interferon-related developmental regulator 1 n=1 Tax=Petrolisthes cinctipes TaxID=88211 RepID=A0AAE1GD96_PETCI|nr:hypothetical protein Pcinc_005461 [Petrolisthes cinctipes]